MSYYILNEEQYNLFMRLLVTNSDFKCAHHNPYGAEVCGEVVKKAEINPWYVHFEETIDDKTNDLRIDGCLLCAARSVVAKEFADNEAAKSIAKEHLCHKIAECMVGCLKGNVPRLDGTEL